MQYNESIAPQNHHPERPLPSREVIMLADPEMAAYPGLMGEIAGGIVDTERVAGRAAHFNTAGISDASSGRIGELFDAHTRNGQVVVEPVLQELKRQGLLDLGSPVMLVTGRDITAKSGVNFIFGVTLKEWNVSMQSVYRYAQQERDPAILGAITRHVGRHEWGHMLGLDSSSIRRQDRRGGIYDGHCLNDCTMQQVASVPEARNAALSALHKHDAGFCADCASTLKRS